jgi:hypothetical protein
LYTLETNFYRALHSNVEVFGIEIYSQLSILKDRFFRGQSYRGLSTENKDIKEYQWAALNQGTVIEIKTLTSTSVEPEVAYKFSRHQKTDNKEHDRVICEFHFARHCSTAIDLRRNDAKKTTMLIRLSKRSRSTRSGRLRNVYVLLNMILKSCKEAEA